MLAEFPARLSATKLKGLMVCNMYLIEIPQMQFPPGRARHAQFLRYGSNCLLCRDFTGLNPLSLGGSPDLGLFLLPHLASLRILPHPPFHPSPSTRQSRQMTTTVYASLESQNTRENSGGAYGFSIRACSFVRLSRTRRSLTPVTRVRVADVRGPR